MEDESLDILIDVLLPVIMAANLATPCDLTPVEILQPTPGQNIAGAFYPIRIEHLAPDPNDYFVCLTASAAIQPPPEPVQQCGRPVEQSGCLEGVCTFSLPAPGASELGVWNLSVQRATEECGVGPAALTWFVRTL